jgi:hypothetical protein
VPPNVAIVFLLNPSGLKYEWKLLYPERLAISTAENSSSIKACVLYQARVKTVKEKALSKVNILLAAHFRGLSTICK